MIIRVAPAIPHQGLDQAVLRDSQRTARGSASDDRRGVDIDIQVLTDGLIADVAHGSNKLAGQFALECEIPALDVSAVQPAAVRTARTHVDRGRKRNGAGADIRRRYVRNAFGQGAEVSELRGR